MSSSNHAGQLISSSACRLSFLAGAGRAFRDAPDGEPSTARREIRPPGAKRPLPFVERVACPAALLGQVHGLVGAAQCGRGGFFGVLRAMPMLAVTWCSRPSRRKGPRRSSRMRSATSVASLGPPTFCSRTVNWSPPKRATVSSERRRRPRRPATATSSPSPPLVPEIVVDGLEAVQVQEQQRDRVPGPGSAGAFQSVQEQGPVGEAGQGVVEGLVQEALLDPAAHRDVAGAAPDPTPTAVDNGAHGDLHRDRRTILAPELPDVYPNYPARLFGHHPLPHRPALFGLPLYLGDHVAHEVAYAHGEQLLAQVA